MKVNRKRIVMALVTLVISVFIFNVAAEDKPFRIFIPEDYSRLHVEAVRKDSVCPGNTSSSHFWDEIPVSPSTTMPGKINDEYWHGQYQRINRLVAQEDKTEIVFFGNSITWYWSQAGGNGQAVWKKKYSCYNPINMGNSGDITPVMLYRVTHGNLDFAKGKQPKIAVLLCGTNNFVVTRSDGGNVKWDLRANCPPEDVAHGVRAIAQVFRRRLPQTRVILMGILPVSDKTKWAKNLPDIIARDVPDVAVIHMGTEDVISDYGTAESLTSSGKWR